MGLADVVQAEEAIGRMITLITGVAHKPVFVGVYGSANHGKTHFSRRVQKERRDSANSVVRVLNGPEEFGHYSIVDTYLINITLTDPANRHGKSSPERDLRKIVKRDYDLSIAVVNPSLHNIDVEACRGLYDLVVLNPNSKVKMPIKVPVNL